MLFSVCGQISYWIEEDRVKQDVNINYCHCCPRRLDFLSIASQSVQRPHACKLARLLFRRQILGTLPDN